ARYESWTPARPFRFPCLRSWSEHGVRRPNRLVARLAHTLFVSWCSLAPDGNPQRLIDQHEPRDVVVSADLAIRHDSLVRSPVGRIELDEDAVRLLAQRPAQ